MASSKMCLIFLAIIFISRSVQADVLLLHVLTLEAESISEYYSRFTRLVAKLTAAGVELDEVSKSLVIINGFNSKFSLIKGIMKNIPGGQ